MKDLRALCESCGRHADVELADGSTWCFRCHGAALELGYDNDKGRIIAADVATIAEYLGITEKQVSAVLWLHERFLRAGSVHQL